MIVFYFNGKLDVFNHLNYNNNTYLLKPVSGQYAAQNTYQHASVNI